MGPLVVGGGATAAFARSPPPKTSSTTPPAVLPNLPALHPRLNSFSNPVRGDSPPGFALFAAAAATATAVAASSFSFPESCLAASLSELSLAAEPSNALSLPTWAIHVSSVVEWVTAMSLVWEYGEKSDFESWKGLSWAMVPLLGGALCACTWHFFYNSESLEILVALQAALTMVGNCTLCAAAYRIFKSSQQGSAKS